MNFISKVRRLNMLRMQRLLQEKNPFKDRESLLTKNNKRLLSSMVGKVRDLVLPRLKHQDLSHQKNLI